MGQLRKEEMLAKKFRERDFQAKRKGNAMAVKEQASSVQEIERNPV